MEHHIDMTPDIGKLCFQSLLFETCPGIVRQSRLRSLRATFSWDAKQQRPANGSPDAVDPFHFNPHPMDANWKRKHDGKARIPREFTYGAKHPPHIFSLLRVWMVERFTDDDSHFHSRTSV